MNIRRNIIWATLLVLVAAAAPGVRAQTGASTPAPAERQALPSRGDRIGAFLGLAPPPDPVAANRGTKLYNSYCAFCHGANATGAEGPDLVRSTLVLHDEKGELIGQVVQKGRPAKGMPPFPSLTEAQVSDIAAFLHMRVYLAANRGLYKVQNVVTGDAEAGQAYFNGPGRCNTCHSSTGDLAHIASKYQPSDLQAAFLYPASVSRFEVGGPREPSPTQITVALPSGQSFTGTMKRLDDFVVSLYDSSGEYHSWTRGDGVTVAVKDPLAVHRELLDQYRDRDMHNILAYLVTLK
jgi:cytochrome c oxidase cbb3-type subunit III